LADLLWSDRGEEQAKSSLRQALFELRHIDDAGVLAETARDDVELSGLRATTDLFLIEEAAARDDHRLLLAMLNAADSGLLTDLDGLDPEFDTWLRGERGSQPSHALAIALESASRMKASLGARPALTIVGEILRLDRCIEEAARLAMQIAHDLGDMASLHRHFGLLVRHLREDCGAEPSAETHELFEKLANGPRKSGKVANNGGTTTVADDPSATERRKPAFGISALAGPAVVAVALSGALLWQANRQNVPQAAPLIAILPLEDRTPGDDFLAQGIWEDTRIALSQHGVVRVLGRATTESLSNSNAAPADYRRRLGVDYVLEGTVRQDSKQVSVTVGLIRTGDGVTVWNSAFRGRSGDPAALQGAIAQAIEGQLRGRLAPGGGRMPDQIATTSEVYALYAHARALLSKREYDDTRAAIALLRRATALDPNFAPAWASLATAIHIGKYGPEGHSAAQQEAKSYVRRALTLAPNLAQAHSTLALVSGVSSPEGERALKRAIELNPNDAETWNWLANTQASQFKKREAISLYQKALEIDPLWLPAAQNLADIASQLGDRPALTKVINSMVRAGGRQEDIAALRSYPAAAAGDLSAALAPLLALRAQLPGGEFSSIRAEVGALLIRMGYIDEAARVWGHPDWFGPALRSEIVSPDVIRGKVVSPRDFWSTVFYPVFTSRAMINLGKAHELVGIYRQAYRSHEGFVSEVSNHDILEQIGPNVAVALLMQGEKVEAGLILASAESNVRSRLYNAPGDRDLLWDLARIRAAQGRKESAIDLMRQARAKGWLPDGIWYPLDIAQEPTFRSHRDDPRFMSVRRQILAHIARERSELGPVRI
jgi:TolB-like protein/DNA-binding SARP family transcriptional activator